MKRFKFKIVWRRRRRVARRKGNRKEYLAHKESARKLVHERLEYFNQFYGFKYHKVSIRNQKTRWGSCSRHGNLNFSYKWALLEPRLADYVIVHELCHLQEFNHSKQFWSLVEQQFPDHHTLRKQLKHLGSIPTIWAESIIHLTLLTVYTSLIKYKYDTEETTQK